MSYFFEKLQVGEIIHLQFRGEERYYKIDFIILDVTKKENIITREMNNNIDCFKIKHDLTFLIKPLSDKEKLPCGKLWIRYEESDISNVVVTFGIGVKQFSWIVDSMERMFLPENE